MEKQSINHLKQIKTGGADLEEGEMHWLDVEG